LAYRLSPLWPTGSFYAHRGRIGESEHDNLQDLRDLRQSTVADASSEQMIRLLLLLRRLPVVLIGLVAIRAAGRP
jgi:hypothetical protein